MKEIEIQLLKEKGFTEFFYKEAFSSRKIVTDFNWANRNNHLVIFYLRHFEMDHFIAEALQDARTTYYSPRYLIPEIDKFFDDNPSIKDCYDELLSSL